MQRRSLPLRFLGAIMTNRRLALPTALVVALVLAPALTLAQRPTTSNSRGASTTTAVASRSGITITAVNLPRADVEAATPSAPSSPKKTSFSDRLGASIKKAALGDEPRMKAARAVLATKVQQAVTDPNATIIVVIGTAEDVKTVEASLSLAKRRIVLAFVDKDLDDDASFNTALSAGLVGGAGADKASNVWVFLPRRGGAMRSTPNHVLPLLAATPTAWNGIFAADGDDLNVEQLRGALSSTAEPSAAASAGGAAFNDGDVTTAKIAGAKVYTQPSVSAPVAGTVTKTDELVVQGTPKDGMVSVMGANVSGWISQTLLNRPAAK